MTTRMTRTSIEVLTEKLESWYSQPAGEEEIDPFAYWFLQVYGIPKQVYLQEMERDNKPTNALARLLFKLMKSTSDCQKEGCVRKARRNTLTGEMRRPWFVHSRPATCVWISAARAPGADACCCAESARSDVAHRDSSRYSHSGRDRHSPARCGKSEYRGATPEFTRSVSTEETTSC